jgi:hypothetical protein
VLRALATDVSERGRPRDFRLCAGFRTPAPAPRAGILHDQKFFESRVVPGRQPIGPAMALSASRDRKWFALGSNALSELGPARPEEVAVLARPQLFSARD